MCVCVPSSSWCVASSCTRHDNLHIRYEVKSKQMLKSVKARGVSTAFGSWDVEKVHAVVARSTFPSEKCQNTSVSDDFWKLRCRKSARRCGAKHISKWKCTKHLGFGPLLDDTMSCRCRKSARRCGGKHMSKSKVFKTEGSERLLMCQRSFCWQIDGYRTSK